MSEAESGGTPEPDNAPVAAEPATSSEDNGKDERMWAMFTHLSALAGLTGIPLASIIAPLIIWQVKKGDMPSIDAHGKEAVNFQISMAIYILALSVVGFVLMVVLIGFLFIFAAGIVAIIDVVFVIIAALKANEGKPYEYPLTIRFIK